MLAERGRTSALSLFGPYWILLWGARGFGGFLKVFREESLNAGLALCERGARREQWKERLS